MEVDFAHEKLSAVIGEVPDTHLKTQQGTGSDYHTERFMVDGITAQAFKKMVKNQAQLILRRWRGSEALPDVKLGEPPWNSCGVVICGDRRHVLGVYQIPDKTNPFLYHIALYSTVTGEKKGEMDATSWPSVAQVCGNFLVCYFPWRVFVMDIKIGKEVWTKPVKDLTYRGPYPPSARPPIKPQMPKADTN
jgi:hypothetical protein